MEQMKYFTPVALLLVFLVSGYFTQEPRYPNGILVPSYPEQLSLSKPKSWAKLDKYLIRALAEYHITARIVRKHVYWFDGARDLSPLDFTMAWGPSSDQRVLDTINVSLGGRYFRWRQKSGVTLGEEPGVIQLHMANMHLIPDDTSVLRTLKSFDEGDVVRLHGYLVEVGGANGFTWRSSLTREDAGSGSCELMLVESAERLLQPK